MASRRSRIKAVANLPARRCRPSNSLDVKKENYESTVNLPVELSELCNSINADLGPVKVCGSDSPVHQIDNTAPSKQSLYTGDRKSVIVSVEKDRKSVIVDRRSERDVPVVSVNAKKLTNTEDKEDSKKSPEKPFDSQDQVPVKEPEISSKSISQSTEESVYCESNQSQNTRGLFRGRRSKPVVNLTAACRKWPSVDTGTSTPCSPLVQKTRVAELIGSKGNDGDHDNDIQMTINEKNLESEAKQSKHPPTSTNTQMNSSPAVPTTSHNIGIMPPSSSVTNPKNQGGSGNESSTGASFGPPTPLKDSCSNSLRRKQSSSAQKAAAARKSFKNRFSAERPPPRSALTMFDLIFYNPSNNPMKSSGSSLSLKSRSRLTSVSSISSIHEDRLNEETVDDIEDVKSTEEEAMPVPRVKVGPDGNLILDEQSLVIETTGTKKSREELERSEVVVDTGSTYGHYKRIKRSKDWSDNETKKFYRALNVVGTDFSLMNSLFRNRTRRELKLKFKKEEKTNPSLINKALGEHLDFDITELEKECAMEEEEEKLQENRSKEKNLGKQLENSSFKKKRCKPKGRRSVLCDEMELDLEENEEEAGDNIKESKGDDNIASVSCKPSKRKRKTISIEDEYHELVVSENLNLKPHGRKRTPRNVRKKKIEASEASEVIVVDVQHSEKIQTMFSPSPTTPVTSESMNLSCTKEVKFSSEHQKQPVNSDGSKVEEKGSEEKRGSSSSLTRINTMKETQRLATPTQKTVYRIVQNINSPATQQYRIAHATPQASPGAPVVGTTFTTPINMAPQLPRMEPGSLIVLKTPIPQNPDRHILQVYMVTNTPPTSNTSITQSPHTQVFPGINLLSAPVASPAKSASENIETETVLTKL